MNPMVMSAESALDVAERGRTLLCFAREQDLEAVDRVLDFYQRTQSARLVRVEPTVDAAQMLQIARYPTFILYDDGVERWQVLGVAALQDKTAEAIR
jgi:hypothetical protein